MSNKKEMIKKFGERLRELRTNNNMTVKELGEAVGLSGSAISRYENGEMEAKKTALQVLANYFKVNPAWLMGLDVPKHLEDKPKHKLVPILGTIAAGQPILAQENIIGYEQVEENEDLDFCLKVKGNSMIGARIYDGDIVFIHKQDDVENGEIAAVIIDGEEATLKRVYKRRGEIVLHSENPTIPDMIFTSKDRKEIRILGKVKYVKFEAR